jgi:hypothetical protein
MANQTVIGGSESITARQMKEFWRQVDDKIINRKLFQDFLDRADRKPPEVWRTISIEERSIGSLLAELQEKGLITENAKSLLLKLESVKMPALFTNFNLALVSARNFGINNRYWSYEDFLKRIQNDKRYFLLPPRTAAHLRLDYTEEPIMEFLLFAMEKIGGEDDELYNIFRIENMYEGEKLHVAPIPNTLQYERSLDIKWIVGIRD